MLNSAEKLKSELASELDNILRYWKENSLDEEKGGFVGQRDHYNKLIPDANKGIILNTRILWSFSAAGNFKNDENLRAYADRGYENLKSRFQDKNFGGVYWELDAEGNPVNKRKQIYAQAFAIYALSEYYFFSGEEKSREWALSLFKLIEEHARDREFNGYFEAFQEDWSPIEDMRLSEKDRNSAKTMNTHLHVLEAYTTLYRISKNAKVKEALDNLTDLFLKKFYDPKNDHFQLFFDKEWSREGNVVSYGHDIEAVWLMIEAARASENDDLLQKAEEVAVKVAETFLKEAYVEGKGVLNEKDLDSGEIDTDRHWWPQIEAMVGLEYAFRISGEKSFQNAIFDIWEYTKQHIIDSENGEWFFRVDENNQPYKEEDKLGLWKCPYHNSRGCIQLIQSNS
ncbi:AGE family epimerase/isomerase [Salinimicrobium sp. GXAS 041]|uniref:AGE family epimerase/isomerase n=1 Tax=Salinimicrobium sp. GXAS 041 TaxID=3400806 RepID=UPI003C73058C